MVLWNLGRSTIRHIPDQLKADAMPPGIDSTICTSGTHGKRATSAPACAADPTTTATRMADATSSQHSIGPRVDVAASQAHTNARAAARRCTAPPSPRHLDDTDVEVPARLESRHVQPGALVPLLGIGTSVGLEREVGTT